MKKLLLVCVASAALGFNVLGSAPARAAPLTPGVDFTSGTTHVNSAALGNLGYEFVANTNVYVAGLGVWDSWVSGGSNTVQVGLWDSGQHLLASATVTNTSSKIGNADWAYSTLANAVQLTTGQHYFVAYVGTAAYWTYTVSGFTTDPDITYVGYAYDQPITGLAFPLHHGTIAGGGYFGGNVILTDAPPVPQTPLPAALPLFGTGLGVMGLLGWRRKLKNAAIAA